jgi:hypothetical protein
MQVRKIENYAIAKYSIFILDRNNKSKPARNEKARSGGQKDFAMCVAESKSRFAPVLFIARALPFIEYSNEK